MVLRVVLQARPFFMSFFGARCYRRSAQTTDPTAPYAYRITQLPSYTTTKLHSYAVPHKAPN